MKKTFPTILFISLIIISSLFIFNGNLVKAQVVTPPGAALPQGVNDVYTTIDNITNWIFWGLLIAASVMILIAAIMFLTAAGNPDTTKKARDYIIYALVAIVIAFLAKAIVALVNYILTGQAYPQAPSGGGGGSQYFY
ncbi:MAG TPA: pilin [Candidatus Pacearchaeota archaeon]|nr:pilin [Candidatus Pacearchaeota archaeon]HOL90259.1 pilin [Candidatus Pacearchaeota archaeon]HPO68404.1 pilin [Candidatus Pacearchaeota archaeon]